MWSRPTWSRAAARAEAKAAKSADVVAAIPPLSTRDGSGEPAMMSSICALRDVLVLSPSFIGVGAVTGFVLMGTNLQWAAIRPESCVVDVTS